MLNSFSVRNFKSFREGTLRFAPLTVLIGANASGKSNILEALRLMAWLGTFGASDVTLEIECGLSEDQEAHGPPEDYRLEVSFRVDKEAASLTGESLTLLGNVT